MESVYLESGLNHVLTNSEPQRRVMGNEELYLSVGTLDSLRNSFGAGTNKIYTKDGEYLGDTNKLRNSFLINSASTGGKRKSRYTRKSKKSRKNGRKSNRRC